MLSMPFGATGLCLLISEVPNLILLTLVHRLFFGFPGEPGQQGQLFRDQPRARLRRLHLRARHPPPRRRQLHGMKRKRPAQFPGLADVDSIFLFLGFNSKIDF